LRAATDLRGSTPPDETVADGRPVVLATLGVPLDDVATVFAVDSAVEEGRTLILVNVTRLEPLWLSVRLGYDALEEFTPEVAISMRRSVRLARSLGLQVERLRIRSPRPITALLELVSERDPGILVFGPDRAALDSRTYRRAVRKIREANPCLLWASEPG
jgi:nucleotide-binding universal stress UspA family protein